MNMDFASQDGMKWIVGVCVMNRKARSPALLRILKHLEEMGMFEVIIFPEADILGKEPDRWPTCHFFISFHSNGFPIYKAIEYTRIRKPFHLNDLPMQVVLQDRRILLRILEMNNIPTMRHLMTQRNGPPVIKKGIRELVEEIGIELPKFDNEYVDVEVIDEDTLKIGQDIIKKPFVEKPVSADDHNVYVYYPKSQGGGVRKLYRKTFNKSSDFYDDVTYPRLDKDYIYEEFANTNDGVDVKFYVVGSKLIHVESRKSPVVDGIVIRNSEGLEVRKIIEPREFERKISADVCRIFNHTVCGFDVLRVKDRSYITDVNSWSLLRTKSTYHYECAKILKDFFFSFINNMNLLHINSFRLNNRQCQRSELTSFSIKNCSKADKDAHNDKIRDLSPR